MMYNNDKSDEHDRDSLREAYSALESVVDTQSDLAGKVFTSFNEALKSDKNDSTSLRKAYNILQSVIRTQPHLAGEVFSSINEALKSKENNKYSLSSAYSALDSVVKAQPSLAGEVFSSINEARKSDKNGSDGLHAAYSALGSIVKAQPNLAGEVFTSINEALKSEENDSDNLRKAYSALDSVVKAQPDLADEVLTSINEALKSEENDSSSLYEAYSALGSVVRAQPDLADEVLTSINEALKSDKNDSSSLYEVYSALSSVVRAQPDLAGEVFTSINEALKSDKNDIDNLDETYHALCSIVEAQPSLAKKVVDAVMSDPVMSHDVSTYKATMLSRCMKNCKIEDFPETTTSQKKHLQAAYAMRYSTREEIKYLCEHKSISEIANMNLSTQQHWMNAMMLQLEKEPNIHSKIILGYRNNPDCETYNDNVDWLVPASFNAAEIFGRNYKAYFDRTEKYLSVHDRVYWLPEDMGQEKNQSFASFVQRNLIYADINGEKKSRNLAEMELIAKNWKLLKPEEEKLKYKDVLAICRSRKYKDQTYENFATEAAKWGVAESNYKYLEDIYAAGLKVPTPFDSEKRFELDGYCGRFLPRDDARTGFFGNHTNCCQHFNGAGGACAISTVKDPYSQLFVIEKNGKIVAGSWVWENTEGTHRDVCFDNIEAIGDFRNNTKINKIYEQVGRYLTEEANCHNVTIGTGYQDADISNYKKVTAIPLPTQYDNKYSDAKNTQVLLAQNQDALPLDKSNESLRFIRAACSLDLAAMKKISAQCFPDSDQQLQTPERLTGLALIDKDKGVVGYCLYDKDKRSIYDMAVLPEYRTDKNASSRKLFTETIREIRKIGGEWSAELRDKTTYHYMETMQQRGLVSFETHGVDHEMSDGSKVYSVTFKINDTPTKVNDVHTKVNDAPTKVNDTPTKINNDFIQQHIQHLRRAAYE